MSNSLPFERGHASLAGKPLDDPRLLSGDFWAELRTFLAVAKAKSFNRAAIELNVSQPKVSKQVRRLQDLMGSQLLVSSTKGVVLTPKGKELAEALLALDERLASLSRELRGESRDAEGLVTISSTEALAGLFVIPHLRNLGDHFPKIQVHIKNPRNLLGHRDNQCDVSLAFAPSQERGVESRPIGMVHLVAVATEAYFAQYGVPTRANLERHRFVDAAYYSSETPTFECWRKAIARGTVAHLCDNSFAYAFMVKEGLGIGLLGNYTLCDSKIIPVDIDVHVKLPLHIQVSSERLISRPVRVVYDWLAETLDIRNPWFNPSLTNLDVFPRKAFSATLQQYYSDTPFAVEND